MTRSQWWVAAALPGVLALSAGLVVTTTAHVTAVAAPAAPHVMVIIMENTAYNQAAGTPYIVGSPDAPYINNTLLTTYTSATNWFSVEHVSDYDYFDLISGADQKGVTKPINAKTSTFVDQLAAKGISWKAYLEGMPSTCYTGGATGNYVQGHNPFSQFKSIITKPSCAQSMVPYSPTQMKLDLNATSPPSFVWITPDQCNDMHSKCAPTSNTVRQGDNWLSSNIPAVQSTQWYKQGGTIILTWDESVDTDTSGVPKTTDSGGHVATIVISAAPTSSYTAAGDHFGTLHGLQKAYGVGCLAATCTSVNHGDISGAFNVTTGAISGTVTDSKTTNPIAGASVSCTCSGTAATTDVSGVYTFSGVPQGGYTESFSASGYTSQTGVPVSVTKGITTTRDDALAPLPGTINGTVIDAQTNLGIGGATVNCTCSGTAASTASDGSYSFLSVPEGSYTLSFSASGHVPQNNVLVPVSPGGTTTQNVALAETGSISGTVTDATTPGPISGATVSCPSCSTTTATTAPDGSYTFSSAPVGNNNLSFSAPGYVAVNNVAVSVSKGTNTPQNEALTQQPGAISGTVTDSQTHSPISGATVGCTCPATTTTDVNGSYTFSPVAEGSYTMSFSASGYTTQSGVAVSVTKGTTTTQNAALVPLPGSITGTVTDQTNTLVIQGASVNCTCSGNAATTDVNGSYTFSSVAEGSYSLSFSHPGYTPQNGVPVTVGPGGTTTHDQKLSPTPPFIFSDDFESGLTPWSSTSGLTLQNLIYHSPTHAAQGSTTSSTAYARKTLPFTYTSAYERVWFDLVSQSTQVFLLQANTATNSSIATVYINSKGILGLQAADGSRHDTAIAAVTTNTWHELELRFTVGTTGSADIWLDNMSTPVLSLSSINLHTTPVGVMQIGDASSHTWNGVFDDAAFDTASIP